MTSDAPFFTIVTVARNDAWAMLKTMRSVFEQECDDFEYVVVDGGSTDGSMALVSFWQQQGLVSRAISEPDTGVYNAMNKGLEMARGEVVLFLNASDVFADSGVLRRVRAAFNARNLDGVLGWGRVNVRIWASWSETAAFKMGSLGFCHQALFVRRTRLLANRFDERRFKTDSDTLQLGRLYEAGARIAILPEVLAIRGGEPGISADLARTAISILDTLTQEYPGLSPADAEAVLAFRRKCADPETVLDLLQRDDAGLIHALARLVLDTLFLHQSASLAPDCAARLQARALEILGSEAGGGRDIEQLILVQQRRAILLEQMRQEGRDLDRSIAKFEGEETRRIQKAAVVTDPAPPDYVVSLTSFPARIKTVSFAIQSLFEQTSPPREVHLWLGADEMARINWLPKRLRALEARGLQVHFAKRTFHQYDKFLHNAALNAERPFVIVDDDVIYPPGAMAHLLAAQARYPDAVVANRCHRMIGDGQGGFAPYRDWPREVQAPALDDLLMPTGAGGVLYPPGFMADPAVSDIDAILAHAPYADDIWLKFCALAQGVATYATALSHKSDWYHRYTPTMRLGTLMNINVERGLNDVQIARCLEWLQQRRPGWQPALAAPAPVPSAMGLTP